MEDIDAILQLVAAGREGGFAPENMLDDQELAIYQAHEKTIKPELSGHYDNLAKVLPNNTLSRLAQDIVHWVRYDEDTRLEWQEMETEGIKLLGVTKKPLFKPAFDGASQVTHPVLAKAVVEFHARAINELFPPEGPVKTEILGEETPDAQAQRQRVQDYMNYQYTEDMPGAFDEEDRLLFRLPISGSVFKKTYYDPLLKKLVSRMIEPADFIVPYSASDLATAGRYTHRYRESHNWILQNIQAGFFIEGIHSRTYPLNDLMDRPSVIDVIDDTEGRTQLTHEDDEIHTVYEMCVYLDLPGFETESGVKLPYKVWIDRDNQTVLRVQRNWLVNDDDMRAVVDVTHKKFLPGLGFYGYGLYHLLAGIGKAATGALNALLDSAAFANLQGGFRTRESRVRGGDEGPIAPGEWRETDLAAEELSKAFFRIPYEEPSTVLFQLLGYLGEEGKAFGGGDIMSGDANPNAPVGTTLALIEQGAKTFAAIFRRLHVAYKCEFRILARLNGMYLPVEGYPYAIKGGMNTAYPADFDDRIDIIPVSDPTIFSNTQRIVMAQGVLDLAEKFPDIINRQEAARTMLVAMRVSNVEELLATDPAAAQQQQELMKLEVQLKQAQIEKVQADQALVSLQALFSAVQTAQMVATMPDIAPIADRLYKSVGGLDIDTPPMIGEASAMAPAMPPAIEQNTSPGFPAVAGPASPNLPGMSSPAMPTSGSGAMQGIETMAADS